MTLDLYLDSLSECSFRLKGPQAGVLTGRQRSRGHVPACQPYFSPALGGAAQRHCRHSPESCVLGPPATSAHTWYVQNIFCTLNQKREKILTAFAHAGFHSLLLGVLGLLKSSLFLL